MCGSECSRAGARYKAERALFLLLCASAHVFPNCRWSRPMFVPSEVYAEIHDEFAMTCGPGDTVEIAGRY